jgi:hypothetical protein
MAQGGESEKETDCESPLKIHLPHEPGALRLSASISLKTHIIMREEPDL